MVITGFQVADVPVLIGGRDFRIYELPADAELQAMLVEKEAEFWQMVVDGVPPPPSNCQDVIRLYKRSQAMEVTATQEVENAVQFLRMVKNDQKMLGEREQEAKRTILEFMRENDTLVGINGKALATWRSGKEVARFDLDTFKKQHKDLYDKYLKTGEPVRRFLLK
jgi:predicted phage-related endonuclease